MQYDNPDKARWLEARAQAGFRPPSEARLRPQTVTEECGLRIGIYGPARRHWPAMPWIYLLIVGGTIVLACLAALPVSADATPVPEAHVYLERMARALAEAPLIGVTISADYDVRQKSGEMVTFGERRRVTIARPDRLRVETEQSDGARGLTVFDGKTLAVYSAAHQAFAEVEHPGDLDGALTYYLQDLRMRLPLALMFSAGFPEELQQRLRSVAYVETDALTDVPCVHLAARTDQVDFQVWIPQTGDPLPRRVIITYRHAAGQPQFRADFTDWDLASKPAAGDFRFVAPADAARIPFQGKLVPQPPSVPAKGGQ
jgi:hypothetical protein